MELCCGRLCCSANNLALQTGVLTLQMRQCRWARWLIIPTSAPECYIISCINEHFLLCMLYSSCTKQHCSALKTAKKSHVIRCNIRNHTNFYIDMSDAFPVSVNKSWIFINVQCVYTYISNSAFVILYSILSLKIFWNVLFTPLKTRVMLQCSFAVRQVSFSFI